MANYTMHHLNIGSDSYEMVDEQGRANIAPSFSTSTTYAAGDYVIYGGKLYQFTSAHTGAWTGTDAEETAVAEKLGEGGSGDGLTEDIKQALLQIAQKVAYIDDQGQTYYDALYDALYPPTDLVSISAVYTQSGTVYDTDNLNSLKSDLVVTAHYSDQTTETVTTYALSGTLTVGTSAITVSYGGKTTTFNVTVARDNRIKVYKGKGVSGTSIVDNPNRALSKMIDVTGASEIVSQWNYSETQDAVKFTTGDTTVSSEAVVQVPESYIGSSTAQGSYTSWRTTTSNLVCAEKRGTWITKVPTSGKIRLLFQNVADSSTAIGTISGTITINGEEYQLVEDTAENFE